MSLKTCPHQPPHFRKLLRYEAAELVRSLQSSRTSLEKAGLGGSRCILGESHRPELSFFFQQPWQLLQFWHVGPKAGSPLQSCAQVNDFANMRVGHNFGESYNHSFVVMIVYVIGREKNCWFPQVQLQRSEKYLIFEFLFFLSRTQFFLRKIQEANEQNPG